MKNKILLLVLTVFVTSLTFGQKFYEAQLVLNTNNPNGTQKTGYVTLPDASNKKVKFKKDQESKASDIDSDAISYIKLKAPNGKTYILERNYGRMVWGKNKTGEVKSKVFKKKAWYLLEESSPKMNYYLIGQNFKIKGDGSFIIKSWTQKGFPGISYCFRRPNEDSITHISDDVNGAQGFFRKAAAAYFGDNTNLSKRITNKEFKKHQVYNIYQEYIR